MSSEVLHFSIVRRNMNGKYTTIYSSKIPLSDNKRLINCILLLQKYGVDIEELLMRSKNECIQ